MGKKKGVKKYKPPNPVKLRNSYGQYLFVDIHNLLLHVRVMDILHVLIELVTLEKFLPNKLTV